MNLTTLINPRLDINWQITTKVLQYQNPNFFAKAWREGIGGPSNLWLVAPPACWHVFTHLLPPLYMLTKWINNNFFANHELTTIASTLLSSMYICMPITHPSIHHDTWCTLLSLQAKTWARFGDAFPDLAATNEWNCKDDGKEPELDQSSQQQCCVVL